MRQLLVALLLLVPALAAAQYPRPPAEPSQTPALPAIGLSLAPIGLPLPHIGLPPANPTPTQSPPAPATGVERGDGHRRRGRTSPAVVYIVPGYGWGTPFGTTTPGAVTSSAPVTAASVAAAAVPPPAATGTLSLDLHPTPTGQLFVEGAYVGTLAELGSDLTFVAGTHRLEIRERGYEPFILAVQIVAGRHLIYRGALTGLADPTAAPARAATPAPASAATAAPASAALGSPPPPPPVARKLFYFIPGCYLGDVPPKDAGLPATCDQTRAVTFLP